MRKTLSILCILAMMSCTWVKDSTEDCPYGFWLQLRYTYNIMDVEAAPRYLKDAYVYIYDADGKYVDRIYATQESLSANNYRVRVEGIPEGDYHFVVWSGMGNSAYAVSGETQDMDQFRLTLAGEGTTFSGELPDLYWGQLQNVHYSDSYALHYVDLMKDTNKLACLVVSVDSDADLRTADYSMRVESANGTMDAQNSLASEVIMTYQPYLAEEVTISDPDYGELSGIRFSMTTLRLMDDHDSHIILRQESTGRELFSVSLPEYVGMIGSLYTNLGRELSVQEYLDRQDFYTVIFYLSGELDQLLQLRVNSWRLRANNHLKL